MSHLSFKTLCKNYNRHNLKEMLHTKPGFISIDRFKDQNKGIISLSFNACVCLYQLNPLQKV